MNHRSQMNGSSSSNSSSSSSSSSSASSSHDGCREPLHAPTSASHHEKHGYPRWIRGLSAVAAAVALFNVLTDQRLQYKYLYENGFLFGTTPEISRLGRKGGLQQSRGRPRTKGSASTTTSLQDKARAALAWSPNFQWHPQNNNNNNNDTQIGVVPYHPLRLLQVTSLAEVSDRSLLHPWTTPTNNTSLLLGSNHNRFRATPETPWNIVVLGGSSAARPADACESLLADTTSTTTTTTTRSYTIHPNDPSRGRYSNILQDSLRADGFYTKVSNMAQGSTTSVWSAFMMDQLLLSKDETIDLIVWDHAINDHAPALIASSGSQKSQSQPHQMLHFFLTRLRIVFQRRQQQQPIPPVLLVYPWTQDIGLRSDAYIFQHGHAHNITASLEVIRYHQHHFGLEIAVVDVARLIPTQVFVEYRRTWLDDRHHPACTGSHLIATMIQYVIYTHLLEEEGVGTSSSFLPENDSYTLPQAAIPSSPLAETLLRDTTRIGSFTEWQPKAVNTHPTLKIAPESLQHASDQGYLANIFPAADMPGRDDRKFAFRLPSCSNSSSTEPKEYLKLVVVEPTLQYLGMVTAGSHISARINDVSIDHLLSSNSNNNNNNSQQQGVYGVSTLDSSGLASPVNLPRATMDWIQIIMQGKNDDAPSIPTTAEGTFVLELCDNTPTDKNKGAGRTRRMWLHQLMGVMA